MARRLNEYEEGWTWFDMWKADKNSMIETMVNNLKADLDAGYNPNGECIRKQVKELAEYQQKFSEELEAFKTMNEKQVLHWCKYDMIKRGVIA